MSNEPRVIVHPDRDALLQVHTRRFIKRARQVIDDFGEFTIALTGGTLGIDSLAAIASHPDRDSVDWSRVNIWWGDERWVPRSHPDRNALQARSALLDHVAVDPARVHEFPASDDGISLDEGAERYAAELAASAPLGQSLPAFDVIFLGAGPDGHVASLFPGTDAVRERTRTVLPVRNSPKPPPERLTLTLPVINSAARVIVMLAGADKAGALGLALAGASIDEVPLAGVLGRRTTLFHVDSSAAAQVPPSLIEPEQYWTASDE